MRRVASPIRCGRRRVGRRGPERPSPGRETRVATKPLPGRGDRSLAGRQPASWSAQRTYNPQEGSGANLMGSTPLPSVLSENPSELLKQFRGHHNLGGYAQMVTQHSHSSEPRHGSKGVPGDRVRTRQLKTPWQGPPRQPAIPLPGLRQNMDRQATKGFGRYADSLGPRRHVPATAAGRQLDPIDRTPDRHASRHDHGFARPRG